MWVGRQQISGDFSENELCPVTLGSLQHSLQSGSFLIWLIYNIILVFRYDMKGNIVIQYYNGLIILKLIKWLYFPMQYVPVPCFMHGIVCTP